MKTSFIMTSSHVKTVLSMTGSYVKTVLSVVGSHVKMSFIMTNLPMESALSLTVVSSPSVGLTHDLFGLIMFCGFNG